MAMLAKIPTKASESMISMSVKPPCGFSLGFWWSNVGAESWGKLMNWWCFGLALRIKTVCDGLKMEPKRKCLWTLFADAGDPDY